MLLRLDIWIKTWHWSTTTFNSHQSIRNDWKLLLGLESHSWLLPVNYVPAFFFLTGNVAIQRVSMKSRCLVSEGRTLSILSATAVFAPSLMLYFRDSTFTDVKHLCQYIFIILSNFANIHWPSSCLTITTAHCHWLMLIDSFCFWLMLFNSDWCWLMMMLWPPTGKTQGVTHVGAYHHP